MLINIVMDTYFSNKRPILSMTKVYSIIELLFELSFYQ